MVRKTSRKSSRKGGRKSNYKKGYKDGYKCIFQGTVLNKNGKDPHAVFKCGKKKYVSRTVSPKRLKVYVSKNWKSFERFEP